MIKYLWIGGLLNPEKKDYLIKNGHRIMSSYKSQKNILDGIEKSCNISFDTINSAKLEDYPIFKKIYIKKDKWSHNNVGIDVSVPYINIKYLSVFFRTLSLIKEVKKWGKINKNNKVYVFCFGMTSPFMKASIKLSKIVKNSTLIMINPDLPQFMELQQPIVKKILRSFDIRWINKHISCFKKEVLYSKHMATKLHLKDNTWIVMEGSICTDDYVSTRRKRFENKTRVFYSGIVGKMYGIDALVDAFRFLDDNYELIIYGRGDLEKSITELAYNDCRIKYYGYCGNQAELIQAQKDSDILVSLINPVDMVSKYCFPSKIFEYMMSGNIVLSSRIDGIPDEYFEYLIAIDKIDAFEIARKIKHIRELPPETKREIGKNEINFLKNNKNNIVQGKRIIDFVHE